MPPHPQSRPAETASENGSTMFKGFQTACVPNSEKEKCMYKQPLHTKKKDADRKAYFSEMTTKIGCVFTNFEVFHTFKNHVKSTWVFLTPIGTREGCSLTPVQLPEPVINLLFL